MPISLHDPDTRRRAEQHLYQCDTRLARLIDKVGACQLALNSENLFAVLVRAIVGQQVSNRAADSIYTRLTQALDISADTLLACDTETLRNAGLSGRKIIYIQSLAEAVQGGKLDLNALAEQEDAGIITALTHYKGVGVWTAEMFLIFGLGRTDILSVGDLGLRRAAQQLYALDAPPTPQQFANLSASWRPYRTVGCWYLWHLPD